jgi:hypothetical protein
MMTCRSCRAFSATTNECRKNTPQVFALLRQGNQPPLVVTAWPTTTVDNWCGMHEDANAQHGDQPAQ